MGAGNLTTAGFGQNTGLGAGALASITTGSGNTASGAFALRANTTGNENTAVGTGAGRTNASGSNNTFIGVEAGPSTETPLTNATALGARALVGQSDALVLGGTGANAVSVGVGTTTPQSTLQVVGNYIQFPTITGAPPPDADCSSATHAGRVVVRTDGPPHLYACTGTGGWVGSPDATPRSR